MLDRLIDNLRERRLTAKFFVGKPYSHQFNDIQQLCSDTTTQAAYLRSLANITSIGHYMGHSVVANGVLLHFVRHIGAKILY